MRIGEVKKLLRSSELVRSNGVMLLGTFVVSVLNYAFYPILSRLLSAAMLGEVQIIIAITTQLMFVVSIIRTVTINVLATTSGSSAQNKFIKESEKALWRTVLAGSAVILAVTPFLKKFLQLNSSSLLLLLIP